MSKLSYEKKINIYEERKKGITIYKLSKQYKVNPSVIQYFNNQYG